MIEREDLADSKPPARILDWGLFCIYHAEHGTVCRDLLPSKELSHFARNKLLPLFFQRLLAIWNAFSPRIMLQNVEWALTRIRQTGILNRGRRENLEFVISLPRFRIRAGFSPF